MKRRFSSLQCVRKGDSILLHCLNQCLSYARCQLHYLLHRGCLNQKTREGWASSHMNTFVQMLNLNRQNISCHAASILAETGCNFNFDYYLCRDALGPDGAFRSAGACPPLEPSIKLGATRVLLMMSGRSVLGLGLREAALRGLSQAKRGNSMKESPRTLWRRDCFSSFAMTCGAAWRRILPFVIARLSSSVIARHGSAEAISKQSLGGPGKAHLKSKMRRNQNMPDETKEYPGSLPSCRCEERSDEAISMTVLAPRLLHFVRNDVVGLSRAVGLGNLKRRCEERDSSPVIARDRVPKQSLGRLGTSSAIS
jgi:hypothetical protein